MGFDNRIWDQVDRDVAAAKIIEMRGKVAVGQPVQEKRDNAVLGVSPMSDCRKKACEGVAAGVKWVQLSLFDLAGIQ